MKDITTAVSTVGNIDNSGAVAMTIHAGAIGKLMSMFSNQYTNADEAVVREYFCNGDDARIEAGSDRPTEVFAPTELQPALIIRDFGPGLDHDGLVRVFSTYGYSTKDETNEQTGGFGIGSKAAFTLGSQFTVTGYKDGVVTTALFYLDGKGIGQVDVRHQGPTTEPNGVRVEVGVPNVAKMNRAIRKFFLTVPKGRALVDGKVPAHFTDEYDLVPLIDGASLVKDDESQVRVQMGPVVYPVDSEILEAVAQRLDGLPSQSIARALANWDADESVLLEVGMGEVQIAPSREALRDTETTVNRLADAVQGVADYVYGGIQAEVDQAPTLFAAAMVIQRAVKSLKGFKVSRDAFTFAGQVASFKDDRKIEAPTFYLYNKSYRSVNKTVGRDDHFVASFERAAKTVVVAGVDKHEVSKVSRYVKRYLENTEGVEWVIVSEQAEGAVEWFQWGVEGGVTTLTLDDYRAALRAMRASNPRTKTEPSYTSGWGEISTRDLDDRDLLTDILDEGKPIIVFHDSSPRLSGVALEAMEGYVPVVLLGTQSEAQLIKRVTEAGGEVFTGDWHAVVSEHVKGTVTPPTDAERLALGALGWVASHRYERRAWTSLVDNMTTCEIPVTTTVQAGIDQFDLADLIAADLTDERRDALQVLAQWAGEEFSALPYECEVLTVGAAFPMLANVSWWDIRNGRSDGLLADVTEYIARKG